MDLTLNVFNLFGESLIFFFAAISSEFKLLKLFVNLLFENFVVRIFAHGHLHDGLVKLRNTSFHGVFLAGLLFFDVLVETCQFIAEMFQTLVVG